MKHEKYVVRREWNPIKKGVDDQTKSIDNHKENNQFLIDGKPFIWTEFDHLDVKKYYEMKKGNTKIIRDYIRDGMNEDGESFNW